MMTRRGALGCGLAALVLAAPVAFAGEAVPIRGAGSTFSAPLYKLWADAYAKGAGEARLSYDSVGSGEGVSRFLASTVDFGASDQPLSKDESAKVGKGAILVPITAGMVVIAYNLPGTTGELRLPRDVYVDIFAGKIANWNDPRLQKANPGITLPNRAIALIGRSDSSGTTYAFTKNLGAVSPAWRTEGPGVGRSARWPSKAFLAKGNEGVSHYLKISEGSIGYVEYGFAKRLGLRMASLENKAGKFVSPNDASAQPGLLEANKNSDLMADDPVSPDAYPIVTYSWMLLYGSYEESKRNALKSFVGWALSDGQKLGVSLGYVPLPASVADTSLEKLATIR